MARILLAESNRQIREFIAGILVDFGHDVRACEDSIEAGACLVSGPIDFLVTDLVLRDSHGLILGIICAARGIPTITLTGREFNAAEAVEDRPTPLFEKPFRFADLQSVLNAVAVLPGPADTSAPERRPPHGE
jgi:DNA-binding NtrC family response regulator